MAPALARPLKELKAFRKVHLRAGESQTVSLEISEEHLRYYDPDRGWVAGPGKFRLHVGSSSRVVAEVLEISYVG